MSSSFLHSVVAIHIPPLLQTHMQRKTKQGGCLGHAMAEEGVTYAWRAFGHGAQYDVSHYLCKYGSSHQQLTKFTC
jgi:hypothetical protein